MTRPHDPQVKIRALTIAMKDGAAAASRATGIPASTIRVWKSTALKQARAAEKDLETIVGEKIEELAAAPRPKEMGERSYALAALALDRIRDQLVKADSERSKGDAFWLRATVGAFKVLTETGNLLLGKPTSRPESAHTGEIKHDIIGKLTSDRRFAERALPVLAELSGNGSGADIPNN